MNAKGWYPYYAGYGPGMVLLKRSVGDLRQCGIGLSDVHTTGLSYIVFLTPDGTEVNLYDAIGHGPSTSSSDCAVINDNRGKIFKQRGGAGITFVSDVDIVDLLQMQSTSTDATTPDPVVYGTLYFPDGGHAAVFNGFITDKWDRHGNKLHFDYTAPNGQVTRDVASVTDPLGRTYTFDYDYADVATYGTVDRIRFKANNTLAEQIIRIKYGLYKNNLRSDISIPTAGIFTQASNPITNSYIRRPITVYLPNNRTYSFKYSEYGDLASVTQYISILK